MLVKRRIGNQVAVQRPSPAACARLARISSDFRAMVEKACEQCTGQGDRCILDWMDDVAGISNN
jgi:hypothetical protein